MVSGIRLPPSPGLSDEPYQSARLQPESSSGSSDRSTSPVSSYRDSIDTPSRRFAGSPLVVQTSAHQQQMKEQDEGEENEDDDEKALLGHSGCSNRNDAQHQQDGTNVPLKGRFKTLLLLCMIAVPCLVLFGMTSNDDFSASVRKTLFTSSDSTALSAGYDSQMTTVVDQDVRAGDVAVPVAATTTSNGIVFGMGQGDVTGPIVQTNMMGYANLPQTNTGLHTRIRARAFVVGSSSSVAPSNPPVVPVDQGPGDDAGGEEDPVDGLKDRWIFLNTDLCMGDTAIRRGLLAKLREAYPGVYGERNVAFIGTHSHAGIAGFHNNLLPTLTSLGVVQQNFDAIVQGSFTAVQRAHEDYEARRKRTLGKQGAKNTLSFGNTTVRQAHANRSPFAYLQNPAAERARYDNDQEDEFGLLQFREQDEAKGILSWYAVHGTSLYENNTLTSTDNKGLAALWLEQEMEPGSLPGQNKFLAGYSQSQVGDTSPNTLGAFCPDGSPCDGKTSTCKSTFGNFTEDCHGRGPGFGDELARSRAPSGSYDWKSNEIIAKYQVDAAKEILGRKDTTPISGAVASAKMNVDMSSYVFKLPNGTQVTTCPAALGFGFAGGTTDGPGAFDFRQGTNSSDQANPLFDVVSHLIRPPNPAQTKCQAPKRILLDTGELTEPYPWSPNTVETQILRVGNLFICVMPGEFTTMSGRRLREAVRQAVIDNNIEKDPIVMLSGPANTYGHYIATPEEYVVQRYEGASTLFGQQTLPAYIDIYTRLLVPALKDGGPEPPRGKLAAINIQKALKLQGPGVVYDAPGFGRNFGDVLVQPEPSYKIGSDASNVTATFVAANPKNNLRLEGTYFEVQKEGSGGAWQVVRTDGHHTTTLRWTLTNTITGESNSQVAWAIEPNASPGTYRIVYYGDAKTPITGKIKPFNGTTNTFTLQ